MVRVARQTARGIVVHDGQLLLMERWRSGLHYFSIPGGGVEADETLEMTVAREIPEETTVDIAVTRPVLELHDGLNEHTVFLCEYRSGEPELPANAPEFIHMTPNNRFKPTWVPVEQLAALPLGYWEPLKPALVKGLTEGFAQEVVIVSTAESR